MEYTSTNYPGFVKDETRGHMAAVLNTDANGLAEYRLQRARLLKVNKLENEVSELKQLVQTILGKSNV